MSTRHVTSVRGVRGKHGAVVFSVAWIPEMGLGVPERIPNQNGGMRCRLRRRVLLEQSI
jgi:hypothetical protein